MQNYSGPFLLGIMWIHSDSPSWEEFATWIPKTVQIKHKPRKTKKSWTRSSMSLCLCDSMGTSPAVQVPETFEQGFCSVTFPPCLVCMCINWIWFCLIMIFVSLLPSSNKTWSHRSLFFYLFAAFLKCTLLESALTALLFKVGCSESSPGTCLEWVPLLGVKAAACLATNQKNWKSQLKFVLHLTASVPTRMDQGGRPSPCQKRLQNKETNITN